MATDSPRHGYQMKRNQLDDSYDAGSITETEYELIVEFLDAHDEDELYISTNDNDTKEPSTLRAYCGKLRLVAERIDDDLNETSERALNKHMSDLLKGSHPGVKDGGFSNNTVMQYQSALRKFYDYHDDLGVDKEQITLVQPEKTTVKEEEMFTDDDVRRMREATENPRDRCLLELFLFTGQRIRAIQTLRVKDVNVAEGTFTLNPNVDGLKFAEGKRALFGARAFVKKWLEYHPTNDPEDYLITNLTPNHSGAGEMLHSRQINRRLKKIADRAGVDKPCNPHQFRHYFVTIAKKRYGWSNDNIKWLIGHSPESRVMETTYQHITDEDRIKQIEIEGGFRKEEEETPLSMENCPDCARKVQVGAKLCPFCGNEIDLYQESAQETVEGLKREQMIESENKERRVNADLIGDFIQNNPDMSAETIEKLAELKRQVED